MNNSPQRKSCIPLPFHSYVIAALSTILIGAMAPPVLAEGLKLTYTDTGARVSGLSPGGQVAWLFAGRTYARYVSRVGREGGLVTDRDRDGIAELALGEAAPRDSLWAAVDLETGTLLLDHPPEARVSFQDLALRGAIQLGPSDLPDRLHLPGFSYEILWVRPGEGAWSLAIGDGGALDADGVQDGQVLLATGAMHPLSDAETPKELREGDWFLFFDAERLVGLSARVDAEALRAAVRGGE